MVTTRTYLGRNVYGLAAILFGIITLVWHDFNNWQQIRALGNVPHREILVYIAAAIEIFGGLAIQWTRTARAGALALGSLYLIFALLWVPHIVAEPRVFDRWGNFFEQIFIAVGSADRLWLVQPGRFATSNHGGSARVHVLRNLRCFLHTRTTRLSFWDRILRSQMDSSGTNVLGHSHHHGVCTRRHRSTFRTFGPSSRSLNYSDAQRLRPAGMAARAFRRFSQPKAFHLAAYLRPYLNFNALNGSPTPIFLLV